MMTLDDTYYDVDYWYELADESRYLAQDVRDAAESSILIGIALKYESIAERAQDLLSERKSA
jgi:hypothetical protein